MKKIRPLTNQTVKKVLDRQEKARIDIHDLPMFERPAPPAPPKPAAPAPVIPRYKHR